MKKGIRIEVSTTDFNHMIAICEASFGYEGFEWEKVKASNKMEKLAEFLETDGVDFTEFTLVD
jgi:hypothetical protein